MYVPLDSQQPPNDRIKILHLICLAIGIMLSGCAGHGQREAMCYQTDCSPEDFHEVRPEDADAIKMVQPVSYTEELPPPAVNENLLRDVPEPLPDFQRVPAPPVDPQPETISVQEPFVIDLATTLRLGGASALDVQIAREKALQAQINWSKSRLLLLPTLWYGINWFHHDGSIQTTPGEIIEASRSSFYTGGGMGFEGQPITANGTGPGNFAFNLSLAEAHFQPLEKLQLSQAARASERGTQNDILRDLAIAYADILQARSELSNYNVGRQSSRKLVEVTTTFSDVGLGSPAEVYRAKTEEAHWIVQVKDAERKVIVSTTKLAEILQLDPEVQLLPAEQQLVPVTMVDETLSVQELIMVGLAERPEMAEYRAMAEARLTKFRQERSRPFLPYLQLAGSVGSFGGGTGSEIRDQTTRDDMVASMIWEFKNLGFGNYLINRRSKSEWRESQIKIERLQNRVIAEIVAAAGDSASYRRQINAAEEGLNAANQSYTLNVERIRDAEGIPLELVQAIQARTNSQNRLTQAICNYNRSQYRLLHAIGQPSAIAMESSNAEDQ
ncbi:MAG: hypothetical protein CMJ74_12540 [Planctomycetaceae bacterium]|nr:hypothetical protein [Planctomycetaceae bacterium]